MMQQASIDTLANQQSLSKLLEATTFAEVYPLFEDLLAQIAQRIQTLNTTTNDYVREVKHYIFNHYGEELTLDILANNVHLTPKYLSDLFKREEQIGLTKYINQIRMEKAIELLTHSHHRVSEISQLVGFNSHSYFIRNFQKYTGQTPEKFRKAQRMSIVHE